jgi:hypothetical protein
VGAVNPGLFAIFAGRVASHAEVYECTSFEFSSCISPYSYLHSAFLPSQPLFPSSEFSELAFNGAAIQGTARF